MMLTIRIVRKKIIDYLSGFGIDRSDRSADDLIAACMNLSRLELYMNMDKPINEQELVQLRSWMKRRASSEPLEYITGKISFMGVNLNLDSSVLIPRPETEEMVDWLCRYYEGLGQEGEPKRVLDLGCGSGAIALSLKKCFPSWKVEAVEKCPRALSIAKSNARSNQLEVNFYEGSWFEPVEGKFDLIVSNPPYIGMDEKKELSSEVLDFEPHLALFAGKEGLESFQSIEHELNQYLSKQGMALFEMGYNQAGQVAKIFSSQLDCKSRILMDLNGKERFFLIERE
jgi:release factor glutamine methyltransferase